MTILDTIPASIKAQVAALLAAAAAQDWEQCGVKNCYDHHRREVSWVDASGTGIWTAPDTAPDGVPVAPDITRAQWSAAADWATHPW